MSIHDQSEFSEIIRNTGLNTAGNGHRLIAGKDESPVLVPLCCGNGEKASLAKFCRRISPGASTLMLNFNPLLDGTKPGHAYTDRMMVDRLHDLLGVTIKSFDIGLVPLVLIANGQAAGLGACFVLKYGSLLAGAVLYRPNLRLKISKNRRT